MVSKARISFFQLIFRWTMLNFRGVVDLFNPFDFVGLLLPLSFRQAHLPPPQRIFRHHGGTPLRITPHQNAACWGGKNMQPTWRKPKVLVSNLDWIFLFEHIILYHAMKKIKSHPGCHFYVRDTCFVYFFYIYYIHMYPVSALDNFQDSMLVHVGIAYKCKAHILGNMDRVDPTWVDNLSPVEIVFGWLKGQCDFINKNIIKLYIYVYVYAIIMSLFIYVWLCFVSLLWKKRPG